MKKKLKLLSLLLSGLTVACSASCADTPQSESAKKEYSELLTYNEFSLKTYMQPVWLGDTVYNETLMFIGSRDEQGLLYPAEEIISVTSYDLKTTYIEGIDYTFSKEKNAIIPTANTNMPFIFERSYYPADGVYHSYSKGSGLLFSEGPYFSNQQVAVTYRAKKDNLITPPTDCSAKYPKLKAKLESGEKLKICFFGDSITVGGNGSGFLDIAPFMPGFADLVTESLKSLYENADITMVNKAKGGETTNWGMLNTSLVTDENPDLVVLCWGMNDANMPAQNFAYQLNKIIAYIVAACPEAEILLVSSMFPNGDITEYRIYNDYENCNMMELERAQEEIAVENDLGIAKITTMHKEVLKRKSYYSMTGNNVNHPTDFLIRLYAQSILFALTGKTI